jgi:hypothetical protein
MAGWNGMEKTQSRNRRSRRTVLASLCAIAVACFVVCDIGIAGADPLPHLVVKTPDLSLEHEQLAAEDVECNTDGLITCHLTPGSVVLDDVVFVSTMAGAEHDVTGYLDSYRFTLPGGVIVTLPCVTLVADTTTGDACLLAGGTHVARSIIVSTSPDEVEPVLTTTATPARICNATLTLTVGGFGVNSAPVLTTC